MLKTTGVPAIPEEHKESFIDLLLFLYNGRLESCWTDRSAMLQNEADNGVNDSGEIVVDSHVVLVLRGGLGLLSVLVPLSFHTPSLWLLPRARHPQGPLTQC